MKRRILVALALIGPLLVVVVSRAGAATQTTSPVGTSTLTRTGSGTSFSLRTTGLQAGHAVTVWWMVFNPDGSVSVQYAAGHVIDEGGAAEFGGHLSVGDTDGSSTAARACWTRPARTWCWWCATTAPPTRAGSTSRSTPSTSATRPAPTCRCRCTRRPAEERSWQGEWVERPPSPRPTRLHHATRPAARWSFKDEPDPARERVTKGSSEGSG